MLSALLLTGAALAGSPGLVADPGALGALHASYGVYAGSTFSGMVLFDGTPDDDGGATVVVRYFMAGDKDPAWLEGVSVTPEGMLDMVVHREGRRIRTMTVQDDGSIHDVVTDGGDKGKVISDQVVVDLHPPLSSPWLVACLLSTTPAQAGDTWSGTLLDGSLRSASPATLAWRGQQNVGGGRKADIAVLSPLQGTVRTFVFTADGVTAIAGTGTTTQWVATDRDELEQANR